MGLTVFIAKGLLFGGLNPKIRGQTGSIYIYVVNRVVNTDIADTSSQNSRHHRRTSVSSFPQR